VLRTPETDWDRLYLRVRTSALGADFPRERFLRTPITALGDLLLYLENEEQRQANIQSAAVGKLGVQLAYIAWGFAGGKGGKPQVELKHFLPFPEWQPLVTESASIGPTPETRSILTRLFKERKIPAHVYTQLTSSPEDDP
jgi:hypothetical protein